MGETYGMHAIFWLGNLKGRQHFDDINKNGRIMLKGVLKIVRKGMDWIHLFRVGVQRRSRLNIVMNHWAQ
jgi:hypothetical protein